MARVIRGDGAKVIPAQVVDAHAEADQILADARARAEAIPPTIVERLGMPLPELEAFLDAQAPGRSIVAYCRGPWCSMAVQGVQKLNDSQVKTSRLGPGIVEWRAQLLPISIGTEQ